MLKCCWSQQPPAELWRSTKLNNKRKEKSIVFPTFYPLCWRYKHKTNTPTAPQIENVTWFYKRSYYHTLDVQTSVVYRKSHASSLVVRTSYTRGATIQGSIFFFLTFCDLIEVESERLKSQVFKEHLFVLLVFEKFFFGESLLFKLLDLVN